MIGQRMYKPAFALANVGYLDFETWSPHDLTVVGAYRFAGEAFATVLAYAIGRADTAAVALKTTRRPLSWDEMPDALKAHHARVQRGEAVWCAWNAAFDRAIWNYSTVGFPFMEPRYMIDAMAQAGAAGLPTDLHAASRYAGTNVPKYESGRELIKLFALPASTASPVSHPDEWMQFVLYARRDVDAMRAVFESTRQLPIEEWQEYWAMEAINECGARVDMSMVAHAAKLAEIDRVKVRAELERLTGGAVTTIDQIARLVTWLLPRLPPEGRAKLLTREEERDEAGEITRPAKMQLTRNRVVSLIVLLDDILNQIPSAIPAGTEITRRVLELRRWGGSKTPAKFTRIANSAVDGVLLGQYVFEGAGQTGRASSRGAQVHNLARDTLPYEHEAIEAILAGCSYDELAALGDDVPVSRKLSLLIRTAFVPDPGNLFVWSDWSQIEARVLPWLAGKTGEARLDIFRRVDTDPKQPDLYTRTAAALSGIPIGQVTKALRQRGKVAELALGYGGGVKALQSMGAGYGLYISDLEGKAVVTRWRDHNAWCVEFWGRHDDNTGASYGLWGAALRALMNPRRVQSAGRISYIFLPEYLQGSLLCVLPSGRILTYRHAKHEMVADLDDDDNIISYTRHLRFSRGRARVKLWPGMLAENVTQAASADILRGTLVRLKDARVRLHTHDEVLLEVAADMAEITAEALRAEMQRGFAWSAGLPLMSEETIYPYYSKSARPL
jgi:DNA polymerase